MKLTKCIKEAMNMGFEYIQDNASEIMEIGDYYNLCRGNEDPDHDFEIRGNGIYRIDADGYLQEKWNDLYMDIDEGEC